MSEERPAMNFSKSSSLDMLLEATFFVGILGVSIIFETLPLGFMCLLLIAYNDMVEDIGLKNTNLVFKHAYSCNL